MSSERHGEEHTDSFTEESRTTDQRRKEPGVRAIDNKMPQLVFVWAGGTETPKKKNREWERESDSTEWKQIVAEGEDAEV